MSRHYLPNNLWCCIYSKHWSSAEELLRENAGQANSIGFVDGITKGNQRYMRNYYHDDGEYPLSTALQMEAPESLILALQNAYPSAASVKDKDGLLPIHLVINGEYSDEVIVALFPGSDDDSFPHFSAELEAKLMSVVAANGSKKLFSTKNRSGSLLLHVVISHGYSLKLIGVIVSGFKNALCEANSEGLLPFHSALSSKRGDDIIHFLLEENLRAAAIATNHGDFPIHLAIKKNFDVGIVSRLIELYPECLV